MDGLSLADAVPPGVCVQRDRSRLRKRLLIGPHRVSLPLEDPSVLRSGSLVCRPPPRRFHGHVNRLYHRYGTRTYLLGLILTMVDYRTKLNRENVLRIRELFGRNVFAIEIRVNIRLAEAPAAGQTIFEYDPSSSGATAFRLLADEFLMRAATAPIWPMEPPTAIAASR